MQMSILVAPPATLSWISYALLGLAIYVSALSRLKRSVLQAKLEGRFDRALRLDRLARLIPGYGDPLEGSILFSSGRYPQAQEFLRPRAFDGQGKPRLQNRNLYLYAIALANDAREAEAQPLLEEAVRVPQKTGSLHVALAACLLSLEKEPERAKEPLIKSPL